MNNSAPAIHLYKRAKWRFGLKLNRQARKELYQVAAHSVELGVQIYSHIAKRSLRIVHLYLSNEVRKLNPDVQKDDVILAVCGNVRMSDRNKSFKIITVLPEAEVNGTVYKSTYNAENMKW